MNAETSKGPSPWVAIGIILVGCFALLMLSAMLKGKDADYGAVRVSSWDASVPVADQFIRAQMKDPDSVKYHGWQTGVLKNGTVFSLVDFTATNGLGGPVRDKWAFHYDRGSGAVVYVTSFAHGRLFGEAPEDFKPPVQPEVEPGLRFDTRGMDLFKDGASK